MSRRRKRQVGDGIGLHAVRAALKKHEFRPHPVEKVLGTLPGVEQRVVAGARRQGNVELGPFRTPLAGLRRETGARVEIAAIFVEVDDEQFRIILERVEDAVGMVGVYVHIGNAPDPVMRT